jgi:hypothetical protein
MLFRRTFATNSGDLAKPVTYNQIDKSGGYEFHIIMGRCGGDDFNYGRLKDTRLLALMAAVKRVD